MERGVAVAVAGVVLLESEVVIEMEPRMWARLGKQKKVEV